MRPSRLLVGLIVGLVVLVAAGLPLASADESIEPTEPPDPSVVVLEPGENYVGWLGAPLSVEGLMRRIPEISAVKAWDAKRQRLFTPTNLTAGMGVRITLSGEEPRTWRRPMTPVKGKVELHRGRNLVTWLGPDLWTIYRVVLGIGAAFVEAEWGNNEYRRSSVPTTRSQQTVRRGDALWIEVSRAVNWLQPAGLSPTLVFAGSANEELRAAVERDSLDAMQFFQDEFGIQPDGSLTTVYIAADVDSLIDAFEKDGIGTDGVYATWYTAGGWASSLGHIVLKLEQWDPDYSINQSEEGDYGYGRYVLTHEYYHAVQYQLSGTNAAQWLVEGGADWAEAGLRLKDSATSFEQELERNRNAAVSQEAPPLDHTERSVGSWHYTLGALASHRLALRSGKQALVEFWRAMLPEPLGPLGRWQSNPPWQSVFQDVFGFSVEGFYSEFAEWRGNLAPLAVRGHVLGPDGQGLPYVRVVGRSPRLEDDGHDYFNTISDRDGAFVLSVSGLGFAEVGVDLGGCEVYYTSSGLVSGWHEAEQMSTTESRSQNLHLQLSEDICVWQISGTLADPQGNGISNQWVYSESEGGGGGNVRTGPDGTFSITAPFAGQYRVRTIIEGCSVYYREGEVPGSRQQASQIVIEDDDVTDIRFELTEGLCSTKITGHLLDADGVGIADVWVYAREESNSTAYARTEDDGSFSITVPGAGVYRLEVTIGECRLYFRRGGAVISDDQATRITIDDTNVTGVRFRLREGQCSLRIVGRLLDANGEGIADADLWLQGDGVSRSVRTESDGSFGITVPGAGTYRLRVGLDGCTLYFRRGGAVPARDRATRITIEDQDVAVGKFQLRQGQCSAKIEGRLLDANGNAVADTNVWAEADGNSFQVRTDSAGFFSITVPELGEYRVSARVDGCLIYYGGNLLKTIPSQATRIQVSDSDTTEITLRLTEGMCERRISGRLLNADGTPRSGQWVNANGNGSSGGASSAADGSFSFAVPAKGSYQLQVWIGGCWIIHGSRGPTKNGNNARQITVSNADVTGIEFRLPEDPSTFCD